MWKRIIKILLCCLMIFPISVYFFSSQTGIAEKDTQKAADFFLNDLEKTTPAKKADGSKHTIAYVDIDPYLASGEMLYYYIQQMQQTGWITLAEEIPFDPQKTDARELIEYLASQDLGEFISFSKEACYYLAMDGEAVCRESLQHLIDQKAVDLIFCMGTWPGTFAESLDNDEIPVMIYFSVDPVGAGLSLADDFSGKDNVWCHVNSIIYNKQLQFYYDNYPFQNIGMVYYDESVAAMGAYETVAAENKFQITKKKIETLTYVSQESTEKYYQMIEAVFEELCAEGIDAFMLNTDIIKDENRIRNMLEVFYQKNIPVFVQNGEYYVQNGALMTVTASDAKEQAPFVADVCARILNGGTPGEIEQEFITPPYLSINLAVADRLNYQVKEELILSAEKLYTR